MTELLKRDEAAAYLQEAGLRMSRTSLARYAMGGGGAAIRPNRAHSLLQT